VKKKKISDYSRRSRFQFATSGWVGLEPSEACKFECKMALSD